jgi:catechol 2,3-dioxygenase-like lactoylglutathione lyase family enzyme
MVAHQAVDVCTPEGGDSRSWDRSPGGTLGTTSNVSVQLNHTIVSCRDQQRSAAFLAGILGLPPATRFAHFLVVQADNGVSLDFAETSGEITAQHYAFLVGEEEFDAAFGRIRDHGLPYWADPGQRQQGVINRRDGGRGLYFEDPDGHLLEILTRPYGSGTDPAHRTP